jgi:uncharacterized phage protein (TIGR02218 family)
VTIYPDALAAHLEGEATSVCHCWRLTRRDGTVSGFTDHDRRLTVDGTAFEPDSGFSASEARDTLGLAIDTVDVEGAVSSAGISEADIAAGLYDDASVETLLVNWQSPADFARLRSATIGRITRRDHAFVAELKSFAHRLDQIQGRTVTRSCDAELGDTRCRFLIDQPGFSGAGTVASVAGDVVTSGGLDGFASGWFTHGVVEWASGSLAGRASRVVAHRRTAEGVVLVLQPTGGPGAETGDAFAIRAGCDKRFATCREKFANGVNFRGFPHLPGNDAAYGYVADGIVFDGKPLVP